MSKKTNVYCRDCGDRLTKENHRTDHTGHIYPDCKPCCYKARALKVARKQHYFGAAI